MLKFPISGVRIFVVKEAISNIGYGEKEANNDGPLIRAMGGRPGEEWCALFAGWCYRKAYEYNEFPPPAFAWRDAKRTFLEVSAKRLVDGLAKMPGGVRFTDPAQALPGDLVSWNRSVLKPWQGHVGVVEMVRDGIIHTIEGNVGAFPCKVKRLVHDVTKERLYAFAGVR